jgi:choline kinase
MRAVMLAAGVGNRLGDHGSQPKSLLAFGGKTLLQRHLENLAACGIESLTLCVGYEAALLREAVVNAPLPVTCIMNHDFRRGSLLSLWCAREALGHEPVLLMDADVLYHRGLLKRLVDSIHENCFLLDEDFVPGDEPVKICVRQGEIVEFRKKPAAGITWDTWGESVGFFKFSTSGAQALLHHCAQRLEAGGLDDPYEEAIRDLILAGTEKLGFERTTRLPWMEIDFPEDLVRAREQILPQLDISHD